MGLRGFTLRVSLERAESRNRAALHSAGSDSLPRPGFDIQSKLQKEQNLLDISFKLLALQRGVVGMFAQLPPNQSRKYSSGIAKKSGEDGGHCDGSNDMCLSITWGMSQRTRSSLETVRAE